MSVSYDKIPKSKWPNGQFSDTPRKEGSSKGVKKWSFMIGSVVIVGVLMVASAVVVIVQQHYTHLCGNSAADTTTLSSSRTPFGTGLDLLRHALPGNGSCVCPRQKASNIDREGSFSMKCYTFMGEVLMKVNTPWLLVKRVGTKQVSWIQSSELQTASQTFCQGVPSKFYPGIVKPECLECICLTESKCKPIGCHYDVTSLSCGYFQIKEQYWEDCGKPGSDWKTCADDIMCSSECVQNYMKRYAAHFKCPETCEGFAREHNGGPNGCHNPRTLPYWKKVQNHDGCHNLTRS